jgi:membrane fusion protein, heavy metal efflux system
MPINRAAVTARATIAAALLAIGVGAYFFAISSGPKTQFGSPTNANAQGTPDRRSGAGAGEPPSLNLSDSQLASVKVEPVGEHEFPIEKESVGSIDFNEDMTLQVFTPYSGRIINLFSKVGDDVKKGQTLYTIDSPDMDGILMLTYYNHIRSERRGWRLRKQCSMRQPNECGRC